MSVYLDPLNNLQTKIVDESILPQGSSSCSNNIFILSTNASAHIEMLNCRFNMKKRIVYNKISILTFPVLQDDYTLT